MYVAFGTGSMCLEAITSMKLAMVQQPPPQRIFES